jgi:acyl-homoserine lactone acylase PvdQ
MVATSLRAGRVMLAAAVLLFAIPLRAQDGGDLATRVEIRRTQFGVPHIMADDLRAAGFALAYVQMEDYGARVALVWRGRGEMGLWFAATAWRATSRATVIRDRGRKYAQLDQGARHVRGALPPA